MTITCFIRYQIDPFQRDAFERYAEAWGRVIPRCGGELIGFDDLAAYERYRTALRQDAEGRANFDRAQAGRFILREERSWLRDVASTRDRAREVAP